jgi:hypothetical protein
MLLSSCHSRLLSVQFLSPKLVQKEPGTPVVEERDYRGTDLGENKSIGSREQADVSAGISYRQSFIEILPTRHKIANC